MYTSQVNRYSSHAQRRTLIWMPSFKVSSANPQYGTGIRGLYQIQFPHRHDYSICAMGSFLKVPLRSTDISLLVLQSRITLLSSIKCLIKMNISQSLI